MSLEIKRNDLLVFISFFLITIGEGTFILSEFGYKIEYVGYFILICLTLITNINRRQFLRRLPFIIIILVSLCFGIITKDIINTTKYTLIISMVMLAFIAIYSDTLFTTPQRVKSIGYAVFCGGIITGIIGVLTGTLGLRWSTYDSFVGIVFPCGFRVKNYAGAVWLSSFICLYIYNLLIGKKINKSILLLFTVLIIITGSKGSLILLLLFLLIMNIDLIKMLGARYKKIIPFFLVLLGIGIFYYLVVYVFPNIRTMAYRLNGVTQYLEIMSKNLSNLFLGSADIAYANGAENYTNTMRSYIGWSGSMEVAYLNILIKNGLIGFIGYYLIFRRYINQIKKNYTINSKIVTCLIIVFLISGFVETYIVTLHIVLGPVFYCLLSGLSGNYWVLNNNSKGGKA